MDRAARLVPLAIAILLASACAPSTAPGPSAAARGPSATLAAPSASAAGSVETFSPAPSFAMLGGSWASGPPLPTPRGEVAGAVLDGRLYVAGGFGPDRMQVPTFEAFDPAMHAWTELAPLPAARDHAVLTALG